jgi:glycine cleavage system H protein
VSELFSPASGEVVAVNSALVDKPETVNADPYGAGWMIRVALDGQPTDLMDAQQYSDYVAKEAK